MKRLHSGTIVVNTLSLISSVMKKLTIAVALLAVSLIPRTGHAQGWKNVVNGVINATTNSSGNTGQGANSGSGVSLNSLSNTDIVTALRQALEIGAQNAGKRLNVTNGFFGNALIKVLMPPEAQKVEATLRSFGMGSIVDKAILSMNRAAEDAAGKAAPIFINAIKQMTITDGLNILKGGNGAATAYLRTATTAALTTAFRPVIQSSLGKTGATAYWTQLMTAYNKLPITKNKINPDLAGYVTERSLNGLFVTISDEENKIRTNPAARVTDILGKVFGAK